MTPQEKSMVEDLFGRIRSNRAPDRDREADALIGQMMNGTPGAAYALVQTVLVQDAALRQAKAQLQQVQGGGQPGGRSFLGGGAEDGRQPAPQQPQRGGFFGGPWGQPQGQPQDQQPQTGGFLRGALQTAAGVAGGALLFDGVRSLFGGGLGSGLGGLGGLGGGFGSGFGGQPAEETVINNYYGDDAGADQGYDPGGDPGADGGDWSDGGSSGDDSGWV